MVLFKTPEAAEKFLKRDLLMLEKKVDAILYSDIGKLIGKYYPGVYTPPPPLFKRVMIFGDLEEKK